MSYGMTAALQAAVWQALAGDPVIAGLVGEAVFDAAPAGVAPALYVALGPEDATGSPDSTGNLATHRLVITVVGQAAGFAALKTVAAAVSDRLHRAPMTLGRGRLVAMDFQRARARRSGKNEQRRIDLWFRAIVEDTQ